MQPITTTPTHSDLRLLGEVVAVDGLSTHAEAIHQLAAAALALRPSWVAADVLGDASAPPVTRLRALAHLTRDWDTVIAHDTLSVAPVLSLDAAISRAFASSEPSTKRRASVSDRPNSMWRAIRRPMRAA